jgi:hypothetical protein
MTESSIEWTDDGPQGSEKVEFSPHGFRIALLRDDGKVEDLDHLDPEMFGGTLPSVGDRIVTLWPDKPHFHPEDHMRVLGRYYVGEFAGDNCWWLLCAFEPPSAREVQLYRLHKKASAQSRRDAAAREKRSEGGYQSLLKLRAKLAKASKAKATKKPTASRPK